MARAAAWRGARRPSAAGFAAKMSNQVYLSMLAPSTRGMHQSAVTAATAAAAAAATAPALQYIAAPLPHTHEYIRTYETSDYSGQPNSILDVSYMQGAHISR